MIDLALSFLAGVVATIVLIVIWYEFDDGRPPDAFQ